MSDPKLTFDRAEDGQEGERHVIVREGGEEVGRLVRMAGERTWLMDEPLRRRFPDYRTIMVWGGSLTMAKQALRSLLATEGDDQEG